MVTWSTESPRSARSSSTSRYESEKRKYHPTASRMTSGSNCRHSNKPQTEEARRSIRPVYHGLPVKLQHCLADYSPSMVGMFALTIAGNRLGLAAAVFHFS